MWFWIFWVSFAVNVFALLYVRWLLRAFESMNEDISSLSVLISQYVEHVSSIHEMEMFYGDTTLKQLIDHGSQLIEVIAEIDLLQAEEGEVESDD
tara:strand:+ start:693 stop:977 length:285 start_codon:yes stop_codon:yes gene_type:complete